MTAAQRNCRVWILLLHVPDQRMEPAGVFDWASTRNVDTWGQKQAVNEHPYFDTTMAPIGVAPLQCDPVQLVVHACTMLGRRSCVVATPGIVMSQRAQDATTARRDGCRRV